MSSIRLAANYIDGTRLLTGGLDRSGHLQLVYVNGSTQDEIEVQDPPGNIFYGYWKYQGPQPHSDSPHFVSSTADSFRGEYYAYTTLNLGARNANDVWSLLTQVKEEFKQEATSIDYEPYKK